MTVCMFLFTYIYIYKDVRGQRVKQALSTYQLHVFVYVYSRGIYFCCCKVIYACHIWTYTHCAEALFKTCMSSTLQHQMPWNGHGS